MLSSCPYPSAALGCDSAVVIALKGEKVESFVWIPFELVAQDNYTEYLKR